MPQVTVGLAGVKKVQARQRPCRKTMRKSPATAARCGGDASGGIRHMNQRCRPARSILRKSLRSRDAIGNEGGSTRPSSASDDETDQTRQDREQVRGLPRHRLCNGQAACATWPPHLSAPMREMPGVRQDQEDRRLNASTPSPDGVVRSRDRICYFMSLDRSRSDRAGFNRQTQRRCASRPAKRYGSAGRFRRKPPPAQICPETTSAY